MRLILTEQQRFLFKLQRRRSISLAESSGESSEELLSTGSGDELGVQYNEHTWKRDFKRMLGFPILSKLDKNLVTGILPAKLDMTDTKVPQQMVILKSKMRHANRSLMDASHASSMATYSVRE